MAGVGLAVSSREGLLNDIGILMTVKIGQVQYKFFYLFKII